MLFERYQKCFGKDKINIISNTNTPNFNFLEDPEQVEVQRDQIPGWEPIRDSADTEESLKNQTHTTTLLVLGRSSHTGTSICNGNHKDLTMSRIIPTSWTWTPEKDELTYGEH